MTLSWSESLELRTRALAIISIQSLFLNSHTLSAIMALPSLIDVKNPSAAPATRAILACDDAAGDRAHFVRHRTSDALVHRYLDEAKQPRGYCCGGGQRWCAHVCKW